MTYKNLKKEEKTMNFGIIVDIALLVIAIFIIIKFTIKGFFSSILDVCKLGLSAIIAYIVRMPLAKLFSSLFMKNAMKSVVKTSCEAYLNTDLAKISIDISALHEQTPEFFEKFLTKFGLDYEKFFADLNTFTQERTAESIDPIVENLGPAIALLLSMVIALIVAFAVSYVVLIIVAKLLENLTKFEGVKSANRWLGLALGVVVSLLIMWLVSMGIIALVEFVSPVAPNIISPELADGSMVVDIFKKLNIIEFIKGKIYG